PERELETDALVPARGLSRELEHARTGRPRIALVVAREEADVGGPGTTRGVLLRRLEADQDRLAVPREDAGVIALHPPEIRQVEHVVGRADDERIQVVLRHQRADAVEFRVVARPAHRYAS